MLPRTHLDPLDVGGRDVRASLRRRVTRLCSENNRGEGAGAVDTDRRCVLQLLLVVVCLVP